MPTLAYPLGYGNVAVTGGTIDGATIGGMAAAPGTFTTVKATTSSTVAKAGSDTIASGPFNFLSTVAGQDGWVQQLGASNTMDFWNAITGAWTKIAQWASTGLTVVGTLLSSSPTAGVGYATGAGGAQTQGAGSGKATAVTLAKTTGAITMNNAALLAGAKVSFAVSNSTVVATDSVIVSVASGGTANAYRANVTAVGASTFTVTVENITAGSLSEAPVINFAVIKGVTA